MKIAGGGGDGDEPHSATRITPRSLDLEEMSIYLDLDIWIAGPRYGVD